MRNTVRNTSLKTVFLFALLSVLLLIFVPSVKVSAYDPLTDYVSPEISRENSETGYKLYIFDGAELFSSSELKNLADDMEGITAYGNVAFVSTDNDSYNDVMKYAKKVYEYMFGNDSGTVLIIDMDIREIAIFSDGAVHKVITDSYGYDITDNIYTLAGDKKYYECASKGFDQMLRLLKGQKIARPMKYVCTALMALLVSFLLNYFIVSGVSKLQNTSDSEMLEGATKTLRYSTPKIIKTGETRTYSPPSSSSGGGSHGGGHRSGGGGHHSSGGGGHHRF